MIDPKLKTLLCVVKEGSYTRAADERLAAAGRDAHGKMAQLLLDVIEGAAGAVADGLQPAGILDEHLTLWR